MSLYSMMQNNAFFPAFSLELGNYAGNHKKETQVPSSSNASTKLQNFGLFMNPQHCDSFHLTGFSSSNGNKDGGDVKAKLVTSSRTSTTRSLNHQHHNNAMVDKQQPGSKRQKTLHVEYQSRTMFSKSLQKQQITSKRSQKLGDRITALQQLVSPYGKTDTASVLYEATVCIKLLHEQIKVLTSPYFQIKSLACLQDDKEKREEEDLVTRGLCLVPFSAINNPDRNSQKMIHRFP